MDRAPDGTETLPPYMQLKLKHAKEDVAAKIGGTYLEKSLAYELFTLRQMFETAEREQSMRLATETLQFFQDVMFMADRYPHRSTGESVE
jgi:hypothetical protein